MNSNPSIQRFQPVHLAGRSLLARCLLKIHRIDSSQSVAFQKRQEHIEAKSDYQNSGRPLNNEERRAFPRRLGDCTLSITRSDNSERLTHSDWAIHSTSIKGSLIDISLSSIAFSTDEELRESESLQLRIRNRALQRELDRTATVLRTIQTDDGNHRVVCNFDHRLSFEQIRDFGYQAFASTLV